MAITIEEYRQEHEPAVQAFNDRMRAGQSDQNLVFYEHALPRWLPRVDGSNLHNEYRVAVENGTVRGAYALKWQDFLFPDGRIRRIGYYHHPISEGIIDKAFAVVGALLLKDAINRCGLLYCLGMGGLDRPLPKMLIGLGWSHTTIPFYLRIVHPYRFLREMHGLRSSLPRRLLMDVGAFSGTGWAAWNLWRATASLKSPNGEAPEVQRISQFSDWSDALWEDSKRDYTFTAVRDSRTLARLYSGSMDHLDALRIRSRGKDVGWAVVGERRPNVSYGRLRVGSIVDCWAQPGRELTVVRTATAALERRGVDLILTNQGHRSWSRSLEQHGFLAAPSNFIFAASRRLAELLQPFEANSVRMHLTRADGDGLPDNF